MASSRLFNSKEICDIVNKELDLKGKDIILPYNITSWKHLGFIKISCRTYRYFNQKDLDTIKEATFFIKKLKVNPSGIQNLKNYIEQLLKSNEKIIKSNT